MRHHLEKKIILALLLACLVIPALPSLSPAQQNLQFFSCTPVQVATYKTYTTQNTTYPGRVWVQCNPPYSNYHYFAVPLTDAAEAARFLSLFSAAFVTGKIIEIGFLSGDTSGSAFNCTATTQCFPAVSATIR